ncbi:hypothetical protein CAEBREN_16226 [Caenorhabditis brenneri]|uniref:Uncharacterized protein n=1 Tax=Caenorhabditis brenneri TaxID=135651 RepID=G0MDR9_CAEBE|nr:hypothetical protein CAEBREN_16226 [Caenorhabditis brenneri]
MSQQKPVSYEARKVIMEHLEANKRYSLAARCPSLRKIHEIVPLTIQYLKLQENSITLNSREHIFQTTMDYPYSTCFQQNQKNGKIDFDLDAYGNRDQNPEIMFGDLELRGHTEQLAVGQAGRINEVLFQAMLPDIIRENQRNLVRNQNYSAGGWQRYRSWVVCTFERISNPEITQYTVRYPEHFNIKSALRNHIGRIFNSETLVKYLDVDVSVGILRFPENFKIRVHALSVKSGVLDTISEVLTTSSFPLKQLTLEPMTLTSPDFQHEDLLSSECLHIIWAFVDEELIDTIKNLPNRNIHLSGGLISSLEALVYNWATPTKPIGTKLSIQHPDVEGYLNLILNDMAVLKKILPDKKSTDFPYCATVHSNDVEDNWELNIYGDKISNYEGKLINYNDENPWMLVLEIMEKGSAKQDEQRSRKREHSV